MLYGLTLLANNHLNPIARLHQPALEFRLRNHGAAAAVRVVVKHKRNFPPIDRDLLHFKIDIVLNVLMISHMRLSILKLNAQSIEFPG
jgi:hypothetical protein